LAQAGSRAGKSGNSLKCEENGMHASTGGVKSAASTFVCKNLYCIAHDATSMAQAVASGQGRHHETDWIFLVKSTTYKIGFLESMCTASVATENFYLMIYSKQDVIAL